MQFTFATASLLALLSATTALAAPNVTPRDVGVLMNINAANGCGADCVKLALSLTKCAIKGKTLKEIATCAGITLDKACGCGDCIVDPKWLKDLLNQGC